MNEWQPIKTAPDDGSDVLVYVENSNECFVVYWAADDDSWVYARAPNVGPISCEPTHWMPLPNPPYLCTTCRDTRPNRSGYTVDVYQAGRYSKEEADSIADIRGEDYPVPEDAVGDVLELRTVVCVEDGDNFATLKAFTGNTDANGK